MRIKAFLYAGVAGIALAATGALATGAQAQTLTGAVSSPTEGAMEGVLVSAKKVGSTVTTTVV
jgi:virginiamycin B lyase